MPQLVVTVIDRLSLFMEKNGLNDNIVTQKAKLSIGLLGKARKAKGSLTSDSIEKILHAYPTLNAGWLFTGKGEMEVNPQVTSQESSQGNTQLSPKPKLKGVKNQYALDETPAIAREVEGRYGVRHLYTTVDTSGRDNITLVPVKAQAGYLKGSVDKEYIEHLPSFWLPGLRNGTFRAFEVAGYSMLYERIGFFPGDIVIGEYVENLREIKDGMVYIIVNDAPEQDNVLLKRCLNYIDKGGQIICKSDNKDPQYPTFPLPAESIKEAWKFRMKITRQAQEPSGVFERVNGIEGDQALIREELAEIKKQLQKLLP